MNLIGKSLTAATLSLSVVTAFAAPTYLIIHNQTSEESNAYIAGTIPSLYPTAAHTTQKVYWTLVKLACYGHTTADQCPALIKMATNSNCPIEIGTLQLNLTTGDITPKQLSNNGYTLIVNGLGETTIIKLETSS